MTSWRLASTSLFMQTCGVVMLLWWSVLLALMPRPALANEGAEAQSSSPECTDRIVEGAVTREESPTEPATAPNVLAEWPFRDGITLRLLDRWNEKEFHELNRQVFDDMYSWNAMSLLTPEQTARLRESMKNTKQPGEFCLGAFDGDRMVGWTNGWEENPSTFFTAVSAVLPEYRRHGIYSALLEKTIEHCRERGLLMIKSYHNAMNNPILIAKMKAGFTIGGMAFTGAGGFTITLNYQLNPKLRELAEVRAGLRRPTEELQQAINTPFDFR